jgi:hypothetical protein
MQKTKIIISLVAIAALALVVVGLASAQIAANQPYTSTSPNAASNNGFWGWIGRCFGYGANQAYAGQYLAPQAPFVGSVPTPAPNQGVYGNGYGYGPCWTR